MKGKGILVLTVVALASAFWLVSEKPVNAEGDAMVGVGFGQRLVGAWYSRDFPGLPGPVQVLWNITADGNVAANSGVDAGAGFNGWIWETGRGSWEKIGPRSLATKSVMFAFDPDDATHLVTMTIHAELHFDQDFQTMTINQFNRMYYSDQDPFDPSEAPFLETDVFSYTAQRVNVE